MTVGSFLANIGDADPAFAEASACQAELRDSVTDGGSETARSLAIDGALHSCLFPAVPVELKLYSREWCSWCIDAKEYLTEKGYRFNIIDVGTNRQAYAEMKRLSEQTYVPTFVAGDRVLANFDTDQLEKFLNEHQINP